jgi:dolichol-phosphate mannosyltransferase
MDRQLSVVVPTYHENTNLRPLVERLAAALAGRDFEVIFVDDDSRDGSVETAAALAARYPVRMVLRQGQRGLATAALEGIRQSRGKLVAVMDADLQHPPEMVPALFGALEAGADFAVASRYVPGGGCDGWSLSRRIVSRGAIVLAHLALPSTRKVRDVTSGFFALRQEVARGVSMAPLGYKIMLEILVRGSIQKMVEVPFHFKLREAGESKFNLHQQVEYLRHLFRLMGSEGSWLRFAKFGLVGASGVLVNEGLLMLLHGLAGLPLEWGSALAVESSIISNFVLNDIFTFRDRRLPGRPAYFRRLAKFNLVSLGGLLINTGLLMALTQLAGMDYRLANLIGIAVAFLWNFFINTRWTWR